MAQSRESLLGFAEGFQSREVASFISQLEDQTARLFESLEGIVQDELEWQPASGMNTIGMLLTHFAIAEVLWAQAAFDEMKDLDVAPVRGIRRDDDGMPPAGESGPTEVHRGKSLGEYRDLMTKARTYFRERAANLSDDDMERVLRVHRRDGAERVFNLRWAMYHIVEHFAGHHGQVLLLRHLYRAERGRTEVAAG